MARKKVTATNGYFYRTWSCETGGCGGIVQIGVINTQVDRWSPLKSGQQLVNIINIVSETGAFHLGIPVAKLPLSYGLV